MQVNLKSVMRLAAHWPASRLAAYSHVTLHKGRQLSICTAASEQDELVVACRAEICKIKTGTAALKDSCVACVLELWQN